MKRPGVAWFVTLTLILQTLALDGFEICLHCDGSLHFECSTHPCCTPKEPAPARGPSLHGSDADSCPGCTDVSLAQIQAPADLARASSLRALAPAGRVAIHFAPASRAFDLASAPLPSTGIHAPCDTSPPSSSPPFVLRI